MTLYRQALVLLGAIVIGLVVEGYYLGMTVVFLTVATPIITVAFLSITYEWWEPAYRVGDVVELAQGLHAIVGRTGYRRFYKVVPVTHKAKKTYDRAGKIFRVREDQILTPPRDVIELCVIDNWHVPNGA